MLYQVLQVASNLTTRLLSIFSKYAGVGVFDFNSSFNVKLDRQLDRQLEVHVPRTERQIQPQG